MSAVPDPISTGLTEQQRLAVEQRGVSVLLSSGAGCGKTHVLTARYLSHLREDMAEVGEIVAITFTERAAREMRQRIRAAVTDEIRRAATSAGADRWRQHLRGLETAPITTIHSFCGNLLRQHAVLAGLDPGFDIFDDVLSANLRTESMAQALRGLLTSDEQAGVDLRDLIVWYGWNAVTAAIEHLIQDPDPEAWNAWLGRSPEAISERWLGSDRLNLLPRWVDYLCAAAPKIAHCLSLLRSTPCLGTETRVNVARLLDEVPRLAKATDLAETIAELRECAKVGKERGKAWSDDDTYERVKKAFSDFRDDLPSKMALFADDPGDPMLAAQWGQRFLRVAVEVVRSYQERKQRAGIVDFQDLLILTRDLIRTHPEVCDSLDDRFRFILVDELQDTDPIQMELVAAICGVGLHAGKLFAVGDHKQSIYRFRGADVELFQGLRNEVPSPGRFGLSLNFRSQPGVLTFVNALCAKRFADYEPLRAHHQTINSDSCVEFLWGIGGMGGRESVNDLRRREADVIAAHLAELLEAKAERIWDARRRCLRAVRPGDVTLLFRSMTHVGIYEAALRRHGLDYYLVGGRAFFAQQEIYDLLNLLRALENPHDSVSLVGTLRSPFCCLSDEALFAFGRHPEGIWHGLHDPGCREYLSDEQKPAVERACRFLLRWRSLKDRLPIARLLGEVFADSGYDAAMLFEFLGERKLANLWKLQDLARSFDRTGMFGLAEFIDRLGELVRSQPREEQAATLPENADVIKLMSIHQSKGLEFPVVVVPDIGAASRGDQLPAATWDRVYGCLARPPSDEDPAPFTEYPWKLGRAAATIADWQEDLRILYVACTRARDLLILSAGLPSEVSPANPEFRPANNWMLALAERFDLATGQFLGEGESPAVRVVWREPIPDVTPRFREELVVDPSGADLAVAASREPASQRPATAVSLPALERGLTLSDVSGDSEQWPSPRERLGGIAHEAERLFWTVLDRWDLADADGWCPILDESEGNADTEEVGEWLRRFGDSEVRSRIASAKQYQSSVEVLIDRADLPALHGLIDILWQDAEGQWHLLGMALRPHQADDPWRGRKHGLDTLAWALHEQFGKPVASVGLFDAVEGRWVEADDSTEFRVLSTEY